jgi:hypothetical protein
MVLNKITIKKWAKKLDRHFFRENIQMAKKNIKGITHTKVQIKLQRAAFWKTNQRQWGLSYFPEDGASPHLKLGFELSSDSTILITKHYGRVKKWLLS